MSKTTNDIADESLRARLIAGMRIELNKRETDLIVLYADNDQLRASNAELLAALKAALPFIEHTIEGHAAVMQIGAAITKAEGTV